MAGWEHSERFEIMNKIAPIALFAYNRPWHVAQTIEALKKNELCDASDLIVFSDGAKDQDSSQKVEEVRRYLRAISGFKSVKVIERECNLGLGPSIISGVTQVINEYGRVIVMEDDLVTSPFFLRYMNDALECYENENKVISIHGYCYPIAELPETFFLRGADCLGWATWKRGWDLFEENGRELLDKLEQENLISRLDLFGAYNFSQMLRDQIAGKNSSWAVRWYGAAVLKNKLTLYPGQSLVFHIGSDGSGTNCSSSNILDGVLCDRLVKIGTAEVYENLFAFKRFQNFLRKINNPSWIGRLKIKIGQKVNLLKNIYA